MLHYSEPDITNITVVDDELLNIEQEGFTADDKREILDKIEHIIIDNRIPTDSSVFKIRPKKRGILLPILVNILAIAGIVIGIVFFTGYFQSKEQNLKVVVTGYESAEGTLLEELKKETEERLLAKEEEIGRIQDRLDNLDAERESLQEEFENNLREKEEALQKGILAAIEAERTRLQESGVSQEEIEVMLANLESEKNSEIDAEIERFKQESEEAIKAKEAELEASKKEFQTTLEKANQERQAVLDEAEQREAELEEEKKALEERSSEAEARLQEIADTLEQENLITDQILGSYSIVIENINNEDYLKAVSALNDLRDILAGPAVDAIPTLKKRKSVDLLIVSSFEQRIKNLEAQKKKAEAVLESSADDIVSKEEFLGELQTIFTDAEDLFNAGEMVKARAKYENVLAVIPEVDKAVDFLATLDRAARNSAITTEFETAREIVETGDREAILEAYRDVIKVIAGEFDGRALDALAKITAIYETEKEGLAGTIREREADIQGLETDILDLEGVISELESQNGELAGAITLLTDQREELNATLIEQVASYNDLLDLFDRMELQYEDYFKELNATIAGQEAIIAAKDALIAENNVTITALTEKAALFETMYNDINGTLDTLTGAYAEYVAAGKAAVESGEADDYAAARSRLESIFNTEILRAVFPGFVENQDDFGQIDNSALQEKSKQEAYQEVLDVIKYVSGTGSDETTDLASLASASDDPVFADILDALERLVLTSADTSVAAAAAKYKFIGSIDSVSGSVLSIETFADMTVETGDSLVIKNTTSEGEDGIIATAKVSVVSSGKVFAIVESVASESERPEKKDFVYIQTY